MSKHTPGPWFVAYAHDGGTEMAIDDELGMQGERNYDLATVRHGDPDELLANALLIAAAPELLDELRKAIKREYNSFEPDNQSAAYKRMTALYAKATGEPQ